MAPEHPGSGAFPAWTFGGAGLDRAKDTPYHCGVSERRLLPSVVRVTFSIVATTALLSAGPAFAGPPGKWSRVTGIEGVEAVNTDEVGFERTADGVLHVAWTRKVNALSDTLLHSAIAANGRSVTGPDTIFYASNTGMNNSVDLVAGPAGGLRVLFAGLFPMTAIDGVLSTATAPQTGTAWSPPAPVSNTATPSAVYVAAGIGSSVSPTGTVVSAWGDSGPGDGGYHVGLSPLDPDVHLSPAADEVDPNVAFDLVGGSGFVAWNDLPGANANSVKVVPLEGGAPMTAPRSGAPWIGQRVSIGGRSGGGVYMAYGSGSNPFTAKPAWWRVGAASASVIGGQKEARHTGLTPGRGGRLWLFWDRGGKIYAARTNGAATKIGQIVAIKPPSGTGAIYRLNGEGSRGPLDLLVLADAKGGLGYFHQRVLPGLTLTARPKTVRRGEKVAFRVMDAGKSVKGATVLLRLGKKKLSKKTNRRGRATIRVPARTRPHSYPASATKGGYTAAKRKLRVRF